MKRNWLCSPQRRSLQASFSADAAVPRAAAQKQLFRLETGKDVKIIVAYKAGSGTDTGARLLANSAKKYVGQTLVIENKPGADGKSAGRNSPRANRTDTP